MKVLTVAEGLGVTALGTFDGLHLGHRAVILRGRELAQRRGLPLSVVTFRRHPLFFLEGNCLPPLLSYGEREALLAEWGVDQLLLLDFPQVSELTPSDFIAFLAAAGTKGAVVGYDYSFGKGGSAGPRELEAGPFSVEVVEQVLVGNLVPSSSGIREALLEGDLFLAQQLLGRAYSLSGTVVAGAGRGRTFNLPTANLALGEALFLPRKGVYTVRAHGAAFGHMFALLNLGACPTFGQEETTIELFLPQWSGDLYGANLKVDFIRYLRPQQQFASPQALRAQVEADLGELRKEKARWQENVQA